MNILLLDFEKFEDLRSILGSPIIDIEEDDDDGDNKKHLKEESESREELYNWFDK
jgi:hypothetical protein